jgi:hypothetical protein
MRSTVVTNSHLAKVAATKKLHRSLRFFSPPLLANIKEYVAGRTCVPPLSPTYHFYTPAVRQALGRRMRAWHVYSPLNTDAASRELCSIWTVIVLGMKPMGE